MTDTPSTTPASLPSGTPRVLFACGGTGGHVYPAIAIADAVRTLRPEAAIAFAGTRDRMEWEAVPKAGYPIRAVTVSGFQRSLSAGAIAKNLAFPFKLVKGLWESWRLVGAFDPDVVVGTGGYASGPVGLAGSLRGRPLVLQEQNAYAGATNKLLAGRASEVFLAFEAAVPYFEGAETSISGNPVRQDLVDVDAADARAHWDIPADAHVLLAMGGSLGAGPINGALKLNLDRVLADERAFVIWAAGKRYYDTLREAVPDHPRLRLVPYLDRMDLAYAAADLAVCRSGAITCSELAVTGTPSVLVPSPNVTADHQTKNALALSEAGAAVLLREPDLDRQFDATIPTLLRDADRRRQMADAALAIARPDAAATIAEAVVALAEARTAP
ncbi:undecaprenyldiphospho-muramoylpentapeptide beta-N-acetylglucosaminyltransferase [Rubrivirga sp. IMCC45206]|uniref:undecaprenyldiphospho-muramoylpentapeptide beta-N-acetylglucosaminyltransferase n=1 Tax=Rubrivirga sp. IMCC45206 TaxID=3391614 RepID=UPI00398FB48F